MCRGSTGKKHRLLFKRADTGVTRGLRESGRGLAKSRLGLPSVVAPIHVGQHMIGIEDHRG